MPDNYSFFAERAAYSEERAYAKRYPDIQYPRLVSVDMSAPDGAEVIQHYTVDYVGEPARGWPTVRTTFPSSKSRLRSWRSQSANSQARTR